MQNLCRETEQSCGKCAEPHTTKDYSSNERKCVNYGAAHETGDRLCPDQMKAVSRYRAHLERS